MNQKEIISNTLLTIGKNVKKLRIKKQMTQQELAFSCGNMDRSTITKIETFNLSGLNVSTLIKISIVLEVNVGKLFDK